MSNLFSLLRGKRHCRALFTTVLVCVDHDNLNTEDLGALDLLYYSPIDVDRGVLVPPIPVLPPSGRQQT